MPPTPADPAAIGTFTLATNKGTFGTFDLYAFNFGGQTPVTIGAAGNLVGRSAFLPLVVAVRNSATLASIFSWNVSTNQTPVPIFTSVQLQLKGSGTTILQLGGTGTAADDVALITDFSILPRASATAAEQVQLIFVTASATVKSGADTSGWSFSSNTALTNTCPKAPNWSFQVEPGSGVTANTGSQLFTSSTLGGGATPTSGVGGPGVGKYLYRPATFTGSNDDATACLFSQLWTGAFSTQLSVARTAGGAKVSSANLKTAYVSSLTLASNADGTVSRTVEVTYAQALLSVP